VPRFGEKPVAIVSLVFLGLGAFATSLSPAFWLVYLVVFLRSTASGFVFPILGTLSTRKVSPSQQGALMGVTTALGSLMGVFSPLFAGLVYDQWSPSAPYWVAAGLFVLAAVTLRGVEA